MERRKHPRINFSEDVLINNTMKVKAISLSEEGIYVYTGRHFFPQTVIDLSFSLSDETLTLRARVQHAQRGVGMGLMFLDMTPGQRAALKNFIEGRSGDLCDARSRVLIVDDNEANRGIYMSRLVHDGLCVFEARDEQAALEILEKEKINLLIVNPYPALGDGFRLISTVTGAPQWAAIKMLILAPRSSPEDLKRAREAGVAEFLLKMSTTPVKLSEKVKTHLGKI